MSNIDPRNPDRIAMEPTRLDGGRRADLDPPTDPRVDRSTSGNWGLIGGLAAVLVLGLVIFSMMGGQPAGNSTTQTSQPAPAAQPAPDTTTTGSVPRSATPPSGQPAGTTTAAPSLSPAPAPEAPRTQP